MKIERKPIFTFTNLSEREQKNIEILELIRKSGPLSRSDISKKTGINIVSVSNYIKEYTDKGLVLEKGFDVSSGGRKPELVELDPSKNFAVGIALHNSEAKISLINIALEVKEKASLALNGSKNNGIAAAIIACVKEIIQQGGVTKNNLSMAGVAPGGSKSFLIAESLEQELGIKTFLGTDAFSAAFAESRMNPKVEDRDLLYLYSDICKGVVVKKHVFLSSSDDEGSAHSPDDTKYLKEWGGMLSMAHIARQEVERGIGTAIVDIVKGDINNIKIDTVLEAAKHGDRLSLDIIYASGVNLGLRAAYLINLFQPQVVVIGGSVENAGELLFEPAKKMIGKLALGKFRDITIIPGALGEYVISLGAAALAVREIFLKA